MKKIAIFVEGQTELIIVRELLLRKFEWEVDLICLQLSGSNFKLAEFKHPCPTSTVHYRIINTGNDEKVLSSILEREKEMLENGFERIIGLRDMYSNSYKQFSSEIDEQIIKTIRQKTNERISRFAGNPELIFFNFAIMEIEAWLLGIEQLLELIDNRLTNEFILNNTGHDLASLDPENTFFCPHAFMEKLYELIGSNYDKSKGVIEAIANIATHEHYNALYDSNKCASFKPFYESLIA